MSHPAAGRDAAEQHFADSILKLRASAPQSSFSGGGFPGAIRADSALTGDRCLELFDAQLASRHLDLAARWLRAQRRRLLHDRLVRARGQRRRSRRRCGATDPALLHYRSGAFYLARAAAARPAPRRRAGRAARAGRGGRRADRRRPAQGVRSRRAAHHPADLDHRLAPAARGRARLRARAARPGSGTASRVAGRRGRGGQLRRRLGQPLHRGRARSTPPAYCAYQRLPLPLLIVCEDNGIGHQRAAPRRAGSRRPLGGRPGIALLPRRRVRPRPTSTTRRLAAAAWVRHAPLARRSCTCRTVRLGGHAGLGRRDRPTATPAEIAADLAARPAAGHRPAAGRARACSPRPRCSTATSATARAGARRWPREAGRRAAAGHARPR